MDQGSATTSLRVELVAASQDQEPILANLLELYIHDFSDFIPVDLGRDGRFGYPNLPLYWTDPDRHPFLIRVDGQWAGFALIVNTKAESGDQRLWDMAEFFILRGFRRRGIGRIAAHQLWQRHPGPWQVRVMDANAGACRFWERAIGALMGWPAAPALTEIRGVPWHVFSLQAGPPESNPAAR